jgi:hypothetical protein
MVTRLLRHDVSHFLWVVTLSALTLVCSPARGQDVERNAGADFKEFLTSTFSVETIVLPATTAAGSNFITKPAGFGSGAEGYGYHFGVALADNVDGKFMRQFAFALASGHPDHYNPKDKGTMLSRFLNAAGHSIFVDPQNSNRSFNWSGLPASLASAALSNAYQPSQQRTWSATLQRFATNSGGYLFTDVISEFRTLPCKVVFLRNILKRNCAVGPPTT